MAFLAPIYAGLGATAAAGATTATVMGTASTLAATGASFIPTIATTAGAIGSSGGLLAGLTSAYQTIKPTANLLYGASKGLSFIQGIQQGQIMRDQYKLQELQTLSDMENKMLNWELDNIEKLKDLKRRNAANIAKSYVGGVDGLDSASIINKINEQEYGEDYKIGLLNYQNILSQGKVGADIYADSSSRAVSDSVLSAGVKLGESAYLYKRLGGKPKTVGS